MIDSLPGMPPFMNLWVYPANRFALDLSLDWVQNAQRYQRAAFETWLAFIQSCTPKFRPSVEILPPEISITVQERQAMPFLKRV